VELQERLADDDHVQAVEQFISQTDHQALYDAYRGTGSKPFRPERLLAWIPIQSFGLNDFLKNIAFLGFSGKVVSVIR